MTTAAARAWFCSNWQYAGLVAALILLALAPVLAGAWSLALLVSYLHLPAYMLHQTEEHAGDRFRRFVNFRIGKGRDVLTTETVVLTNVGAVWIVFLAALYRARFVALILSRARSPATPASAGSIGTA